MAKAVIAYDKDLPEIPDRRPWERPASYLVKDDAATPGWRVDESGPPPGRLLSVPEVRAPGDARTRPPAIQSWPHHLSRDTRRASPMAGGPESPAGPCRRR